MKDIVGYEGLYGIEEDGRVWNYTRNRYLTPTINSKGYFVISLSRGSIYKNYLLHRLIAIAYIPNPDNKPVIDHINREKSDNRIENLRWATFAENSHNSSAFITNKLNQKYIGYYYNQYVLRIKRNNILHIKYFKTEQEAIDYRDEYLNTISQS